MNNNFKFINLYSDYKAIRLRIDYITIFYIIKEKIKSEEYNRIKYS